MSGSQGFANVTPEEYFQYTPVSTLQAIQRKVNVEFLPDSQQNFSYESGQTEIRFNIQSNSEVLIGSQSYLKFDLDVTCPTLGSASTQANAASQPGTKDLTFEAGGVHSLFSKIEVRANMSSTTIQLQESYNKYYVAVTRNMDPRALQHRPSQLSGDGEPDGLEWANQSLNTGAETAVVSNIPWRLLSYHIDNATDVSATNICTMKLMMYPLLSFLRSNIPLFIMRNGIQIIFTLAPSIQACHVRTIMIDSNKIKSSVQGDKMSLSGAASGLYSASYFINASASNYPVFTIKNPRFVARLSLPTEEYAAQWIQRYRSPEGVIMSIPSCRRLVAGFQTGNTSCNLIMVPGVRSLRYVLAGWHSSLYDDPTQFGAISIHSTKHFPKYWPMKYHYWRVGAVDFPLRPVDQQTANATTVLNLTFTNGAPFQCVSPLCENLKEIFGVDDSVAMQYYLQPRYNKYFTSDGTDAFARHGTIGYLGQDFSKDIGPNGELTGVDCSVTPLEFHCEFEKSWAQDAYTAPVGNPSPYVSNDTGGNPNFYVFCFHDAWARIGADGIHVLQ